MDIPVFIHGKAAWAEGAGDEFSDCTVDEPWLALLLPPVTVSTAEIFGDPNLQRLHDPISVADFSAGLAGNDLEPVTFKRHPEVARAHGHLALYGPARMSGTGGAVFVPLDSRVAAERVVAGAPPSVRGFCARACNLSPISPHLDRS